MADEFHPDINDAMQVAVAAEPRLQDFATANDAFAALPADAAYPKDTDDPLKRVLRGILTDAQKKASDANDAIKNHMASLEFAKIEADKANAELAAIVAALK